VAFYWQQKKGGAQRFAERGLLPCSHLPSYFFLAKKQEMVLDMLLLSIR